MYSKNFCPIWTCVLEEEKSDEGKPSVQLDFYFRVHFVKKIPFIGGKIAKEATKEFRENKVQVFIPLV